MNNKMVFGQYVEGNSWIHRLDASTKIIVLFFMMISLFIVSNLYFLLGILCFIWLIVLTTRLPLSQFLKSFRAMATLLCFTLIFQILFNTTGEIIHIGKFTFSFTFDLTILSLIIGIIILLLYIILGKWIHKYRFITFIILVLLIFYLQTIIHITPIIVTYNISFHMNAFYSASRVFLRILSLLSLSALLTFTTKPIDLNNGIETIFHPLKFLRKYVSIFGMMMSIALRFIPTLFNESQKILKAQASRGADFQEGSIKQKIGQIISLLIPMFVISYKRAEDLANAMEARGYIPGDERTKLHITKFRITDICSYIFLVLFFTFVILSKVLWGL